MYYKKEPFHKDWTRAIQKKEQVKVEKKQAAVKKLQRLGKNKPGGKFFKQYSAGRKDSPGKKDRSVSALSLNYTNSALSGHNQ